MRRWKTMAGDWYTQGFHSALSTLRFLSCKVYYVLYETNLGTRNFLFYTSPT